MSNEPIEAPAAQEDSMAVPPSPDQGNVPVDAPDKPSEPSANQGTAPAEETGKSAETPAEELYDLPDGRKVDAATLSKVFKEDFMPEFTRKSQALAEAKARAQLADKANSPMANPEWTPQTYAELAEAISQELEAKQERQRQERAQTEKALEDAVSTQLAEIRASDSSLNENALFHHATKYGFRDLKAAHQNMKDMAELSRKAGEIAAKNVAKRADPVSVSGASGGVLPDPSSFQHARDYLASIRK